MGLTIHYGGGNIGKKSINEVLDRLENIAKFAGWEVRRHAEVMAGTVKDFMTGEIIEKKALFGYRGIIINLPGCESFELAFNARTGDVAKYYKDKPGVLLHSKNFFCKTQFANNFAESHHAICLMLDMVKTEYVPGLEVSDEGGYFGTWDPATLEINKAEFDRIIDQVGAALQSAGYKTIKGQSIQTA